MVGNVFECCLGAARYEAREEIKYYNATVFPKPTALCWLHCVHGRRVRMLKSEYRRVVPVIC